MTQYIRDSGDVVRADTRVAVLTPCGAAPLEVAIGSDGRAAVTRPGKQQNRRVVIAPRVLGANLRIVTAGEGFSLVSEQRINGAETLRAVADEAAADEGLR